MRIVQVTVTLVALIALTNLAGWALHAPVLISILPDLPAMVPVTASLSLLMALGVWRARRSSGSEASAVAIPMAVMLACIAIEFCYFTGAAPWPFLLAESGREEATSLSSPMTAGMFFALAFTVMLAADRARAVLAQVLALSVLLLAVLNMAGYLFRDTSLFQVLPGQGTSILTTTELILLSAGALYLQPRHGLMRALTGDMPGARISRALLLWSLFVPVLAGGLATAGARAGIYDTGTVLPLFVWLVVVLFLFIIWRMALQLAAVDVERATAQEELQTVLGELRDEHDRKDLFMATLAHELRNPLAPISAAAEVLKHGGGRELVERQRIGTVIASQATHLVNLVNDLLDVERLNTGRITLDKHPLDIRLAVQGALDQTKPMMQRRAHVCSVEMPVGPVLVCGDHTRLQQVIANLLSNAAKYTAPGGAIRVRAHVQEKLVCITVEDNGIGISDALQGRLFEPYVQAELTSDRTEGGLGLGLALVKRLTELHEGTVSADSKGVGTGSTFTVSLPLL